jgi:hypothetical protein
MVVDGIFVVPLVNRESSIFLFRGDPCTYSNVKNLLCADRSVIKGCIGTATNDWGHREQTAIVCPGAKCENGELLLMADGLLLILEYNNVKIYLDTVR